MQNAEDPADQPYLDRHYRRESSGGMERLGVWNCIFRALNFEISEPEIWRKSLCLRNFRHFPGNFGLWNIFFGLWKMAIPYAANPYTPTKCRSTLGAKESLSLSNPRESERRCDCRTSPRIIAATMDAPSPPRACALWGTTSDTEEVPWAIWDWCCQSQSFVSGDGSYRAQTQKTIKVTQKWLRSDFLGSTWNRLKNETQVTQKWLFRDKTDSKSHFWVTFRVASGWLRKVTFD